MELCDPRGLLHRSISDDAFCPFCSVALHVGKRCEGQSKGDNAKNTVDDEI